MSIGSKQSFFRLFVGIGLLLGVAGMVAAQGQRGPQPPFKPTASDNLKANGGDIKITPVNHAGVMFEYQGKVIYADPVGNYSELPKADLILITDVHGDHVNAGTIGQLKKDGTVIVAPSAVAKTVTEAKVVDPGASTDVKLDKVDVKIDTIPMYNLTRGPAAGQLFHTKGRGDGFILNVGGKRIYLAGDTECIPEMKALKNIDVAFIPMNLPYTMTPEEAAECAKAFKPKVVYPYHYMGTDTQKFADAMKGTAGVEVRLRNWY
jgi:L-ascorbate metabolism protein UlaG (beta-lactamase superfamily)